MGYQTRFMCVGDAAVGSLAGTFHANVISRLPTRVLEASHHVTPRVLQPSLPVRGWRR